MPSVVLSSRVTSSVFHVVSTKSKTMETKKVLSAVVVLMASSTGNVDSKISVMVVILLVSFFAVSFPTISKQSRLLRIPGILFFIGKHFGTGVILATAFIHLLDDAFRSLQSDKIEEKYGRIGKWTGLIILAALLAIFLVEYISTTYVEHLRDKPSAPPTPTASTPSSPTALNKNRLSHSRSRSVLSKHELRQSPNPDALQVSDVPRGLAPYDIKPISESTPLLVSQTTNTAYVEPRRPTILGTELTRADVEVDDLSNGGRALSHTLPRVKMVSKYLSTPNFHHRSGSSAHHHSHRSQSREHHGHSHSYHSHHSHHTHQLPALHIPDLLPIEVLNNSPRICRLGLVDHHPQSCHNHHEGHAHNRSHPPSRRQSVVSAEAHIEGQEVDIIDEREEDGVDVVCVDRALEDEGQHHHDSHNHPQIGRRRQIVSILVLQLGIMIHSLVIGLTLAVTSGSDFTSLTTAIIFHQLFEGLSLGIRIAALPPKRKHRHHHAPKPLTDEEVGIDEVQDAVSSSSGSTTAAAIGTPCSSDAFGKVSDRRDFVEPTLDESQASPHSTRPSSCPQPHDHHSSLWARIRRRWGRTDVHWLKPTLSFLFAVTTPFGMCVGMKVWGSKTGPTPDEAQMLLIQGLMSAISAGMLIYAATVEMLAGDFVFGDVEGHGGHHHHHHEGSSEGHGNEGDNAGGASMGKRMLAVFSLLLGAVGMVLIGLGE